MVSTRVTGFLKQTWTDTAGCDRVGGRHITFRSTTIRSTDRLGWSIPLDTQCPRGYYVELKPTPYDTRTYSTYTCSRPPASQTTHVIFVQHGVSSSRLSWATFPRSIKTPYRRTLSDLMETMITEPKKPTMLELIQRNASGGAYSSASLPTTVGQELLRIWFKNAKQTKKWEKTARWEIFPTALLCRNRLIDADAQI